MHAYLRAGKREREKKAARPVSVAKILIVPLVFGEDQIGLC